jgi:ketosteroid isomerase-like protein
MGSTEEAAVRGFADAITRGDVEAAVERAHPEIEFLSVLAVSGRAYHGHDGVRQYFADVAAAWSEWRVEIHLLTSAPDGRVVIVMSTHMRGRGSGVPFAQRLANLWEFEDELLRRATLYTDPAEALRAVR